MRKIVLGLIVTWMLCLGVAPAQAAGGTTLIAYNTVNGILAGNIWEYTTQDVLQQRLRNFPLNWPVFLMGTSLNYYHIGELVGFGTVGRPEFYWNNPEYPYDSRPIGREKLGVAALMICDPEDRMELLIPAGVNLHQEIIRQLNERGINLAAIHAEGTFKELTYSIAFNIEKKGIDPKNLSSFTSVYQEPAPSDWRLMGVLATDPQTQPLLTYGGIPCHLHGIQQYGLIGGHMVKVVPDQVRVSVYPIYHSEVNLADLVLEVISANNQRIVLKVSNRGLAHCDHVKVTASLPDGKLVLSTRLATLAPQGAEFIDLGPTAPIQGSRVTFSIDPQNEILEFNENNNTIATSVR